MGTCELCGTDNVSTHQVIASEVKVDACNRCIEKMQLPLFESPFEKISRQHQSINHMSTSCKASPMNYFPISTLEFVMLEKLGGGTRGNLRCE
jgi:ribosome-binding protein aMBF1 (putative translation factor)